MREHGTPDLAGGLASEDNTKVCSRIIRLLCRGTAERECSAGGTSALAWDTRYSESELLSAATTGRGRPYFGS